MPFPSISRRGQWKDTLTLVGDNGLPVDLTTADLRLTVECQRPDYRTDYGIRYPAAAWPVLVADTGGTGLGTLTLPSPTVLAFQFPADAMKTLWPGTYVVSLEVTIGSETENPIRETMVVF